MENEEEYLLKIGELAAMAGVSVKALHIYEKKNIITPVKVDQETGYRYYSPDQVQRLEGLLSLQDMGFTLNEIALILSGSCTKEDLAVIFEKKKGVLQELIWKTEERIKQLVLKYQLVLIQVIDLEFQEKVIADQMVDQMVIYI